MTFVPAFISEENREDIGKQIEHEIAQIVYAREENYYPMQSGVRWPNDKCQRCEMLGLCLNDKQLVEERLVRVDDIGWGE